MSPRGLRQMAEVSMKSSSSSSKPMKTPVKCLEEDKTFHKKYQDRIRENLELSRELRKKDDENVRLKEQCENLKKLLKDERKSIQEERDDWSAFKNDLLLVVRAADGYKTDAMQMVAKWKSENEALKAKVLELQGMLATFESPCTCEQTAGAAAEFQKLLDHPSGDYVISREEGCSSDESVGIDRVDGWGECRISENVEITPETKPSTAPCDNKENVDVRSRLAVEDKSLKPSTVNGAFVKRFNGISHLSNKQSDRDADPLVTLRKANGGSKRNALLRWCQSRTKGYSFVEITNFSSSWSDGMALNALLHSYIPDAIPYDKLRPENCRENFEIAFRAADSVSIPASLTIDDMISSDIPSWEKVMKYVLTIYSKFQNCD